MPLSVNKGESTSLLPMAGYDELAVDITAEPTPLLDSQAVPEQQARNQSSTSTNRPGIHRRSSVIVAKTGQRLQRMYSFWDATMDEAQIDNEEEEEDDHEQPTTNNANIATFGLWYRTKKYISSKFTKAILKASFAYLIASFAVYLPFFSNWLGVSDSKHLVCTIVVYFHSSRSKGSMIQSLMFVVISLSFAFTVSIGLMSISARFYNQDDEEIGHLIDLILCCTSLGLVSFTKQLVNKPTFNTACSLSAIVIISCVIKEGSINGSVVPYDKIQSSFLIVTTGCIISACVCYFLWPSSGVERLKNQLNENADIVSTSLRKITNGFLRMDSMDLSDMDSLVGKLKKNLQAMKGSLEEAKFELLVKGKEWEYLHLTQLVDSCQKLHSTLSGLKRSVEFKWELLNESDGGIYNEHSNDGRSLASYLTRSSSIYNVVLAGSDDDETDELSEDSQAVSDAKELFDLFIYHLGPPTKSFCYTMRQILDGVPFESNTKEVEELVDQYESSLKMAIELYNSSQSKAIGRLYGQDIFKQETDFEGKVDQEDVAASCGNFSFLLLQFSNELSDYLEILKDIKNYEMNPTDYAKSFNFLKFWKSGNQTTSQLKDEFNPTTIEDILTRPHTEQSHYAYNSRPTTTNEKFGYKIWKLSKAFRSIDVQFGFRVGLGAMAIAVFAYWDKTRFYFSEWRGEWALVTYCIIMNKSVGGTNMTVKWRFLGTFIGAFAAWLVWTICFPNVLLMALIGFFICIPCFDIILNWSANNAFGRFILLTYNLTVLYSYTMSRRDGDLDDDEGGDEPIITEIAFHRYLGVSLGVIWAIFVTMTLFPMSARSRIRKGLSVLWLRLGIIWRCGPLNYKIDESNEYSLVGIKDRIKNQSILSELEVLLKQAPMEVRLKGPFPSQIYEKILKSTTKIMDAFENMNSIIEVDKKLSYNEFTVLRNLEPEMLELENRVFLIFYMLASAMRLGFPLANKPASTEHAMERMLAKLSEIRKRGISIEKQSLTNEDFVLLYTYNLVTKSITNELDRLLNLVVELYGTVTEDILEL